MAFSDTFRNSFAIGLIDKFDSYRQLIHPSIFNRKGLYRLAFTDLEWKAMHILIDSPTTSVIRNTMRFEYRANVFYPLGPEGRNKAVTLNFPVPNKDWPFVAIQDTNVPEGMRCRIEEWIVESKRLIELGHQLGRNINSLIRDLPCATRCPVNTPAQLQYVWPELIPFLGSTDRDILSRRKVKLVRPQLFTEDQVREFQEAPIIEELNTILIGMALTTPEPVDSYPTIS